MIGAPVKSGDRGRLADGARVRCAPSARAKEASMDIRSWVERYGRAWREKDDEAVAVLFAEGALYVSHPLRPPHRGREGIRAYWRRATADQEGLDLRFGEPVVSADGRRAAVEWWATMRDGGWAAAEGAGTTDSRSRGAWCYASPKAGCARNCASTGTSASDRRCGPRKAGACRPAAAPCHGRGS